MSPSALNKDNPIDTVPASWLKRIILDPQGDMPLHAQLRRSLRSIIEEQCVHGQKFFTEPQLIERLGVSQSTVRRALLDLTREGLLQRRVAKGSFVQKEPAGATKVFTVHVFLPEWNSEFLMGLLEMLAGGCQQLGHRIQIHYTHQGEKSAYDCIADPAEAAGVILLSNEPHATLDLYQAFSARGYRTVNIDCRIENYPGAFVGTSNAAVVKLALDHLTALGHQRITFLINEPEEHGNVLLRTSHFQEEVMARALSKARVFHCGTHFYEDGFQATYRKMPELMRSQPTPTAIFAMSDPGAWAALQWFAEQGIRVPEDISVIGFSDDRPSRFTRPALTTIAHPVAEMAKTALEYLQSPEHQHRSCLLKPQLIVRDSTGLAPKSEG